MTGQIAAETSENLHSAPEVAAARGEVKPPEQTVLPQNPVPSLPIPPQHVAEPAAPVASAQTDEEKAIEQKLAEYLGNRLSADLLAGLSLTVRLDASNRVTALGDSAHAFKDIGLTLSGDALKDHALLSRLKEEVVMYLHQHPAFAGQPLKPALDEATHTVVYKAFGLTQEKVAALTQDHPLVKQEATPEHVCAGAGCSHCAPTQHPAAEKAKEAQEAAATAVGHIPETTVKKPEHKGHAANDQEVARGVA